MALTATLVLVWSGLADAADWGTIVPLESTTESVRAVYGQPSSASTTKVDGRETVEWTYEGESVPRGMIRMVVQFGVLRPEGYQADRVRTFRLEPKPGVFSRRQVLVAWGKPDQGGLQDGVPFMVYKSGLTVYFDKDVLYAVSMWFTAPRPEAEPKGKP